ncbi:MAG: Rv3235 family protein [Micrococcus sp.]|nr:Rv3235 family protein [Micrococcus sp.]
MSTTNLTAPHGLSGTLTVSTVPPALPPRSAAGAHAIGRPDPQQSPPAWTPVSGPTEASAGGRARAERRREEERHIRSLARIVALACVEAELGLRPARQLSAWLDLPTYGKMARRADLAGRIRPGRGATGAPRALGARCCPAGDGIYEASATVQLPDRVRAMALRIERHRDRWKVTALELG